MPGYPCCCTDTRVDVITYDNGRERLWANSVSTFPWSFSSTPAGYLGMQGVAYAPSFTGDAVVSVGSSTTAENGLYLLDVATGVVGSMIGSSVVVSGLVFQECASRVCAFLEPGPTFVALELYSVQTGGTQSLESASIDGPAVRASGGGIWRLDDGDPLKIFEDDATVRVNLASVVVDADELYNIVSEDGTDFWVLARGEVATDEWVAELIHVTSGGTGTLMASDTLADTRPPCAFTLIGDYIYWINPGDDDQASHVVRYSIVDDVLEIVLVKVGAQDWTIPDEAGKCFVVETGN